MKNIRILTYISCFLFHSILFSQPNPLRLEISLPKSDFLLSESIYLHMSIINSGDADVSTQSIRIGDEYLRISIHNEVDQLFPLRDKNIYKDTSITFLISSYDTIEREVQLLNRYGIGGFGPDKRFPTPFTAITYLPIDKYTITASFETGHGLITSNTLTFSVTEPQGEELYAYQFFTKATLKRNIEKNDELVSMYPHSIYAIEALRMETMIYGVHKEEKLKFFNAAKMLIEHYPLHGAAMDAFNEITNKDDSIIPLQDKIILFKNISEKYPDTRIGKMARQLLKEE